MKKVVRRRPTETLAAGPALALAVFGFCSQAGLGEPWSAIAGLVFGFLPLAVSEVVASIRQ